MFYRRCACTCAECTPVHCDWKCVPGNYLWTWSFFTSRPYMSHKSLRIHRHLSVFSHPLRFHFTWLKFDKLCNSRMYTVVCEFSHDFDEVTHTTHVRMKKPRKWKSYNIFSKKWNKGEIKIEVNLHGHHAIMMIDDQSGTRQNIHLLWKISKHKI